MTYLPAAGIKRKLEESIADEDLAISEYTALAQDIMASRSHGMLSIEPGVEAQVLYMLLSIAKDESEHRKSLEEIMKLLEPSFAEA